MPRVLSELTLRQMINIVNIIKDDSIIYRGPYSLKDCNKIAVELNNRTIEKQIDLFLDSRNSILQIDSLFENCVIDNTLNKVNLTQYVYLKNKLQGKYCSTKLNNFKISSPKIMASFHDCKSLFDAVKLYNESRNISPLVSEVFRDSILPIIINTPYPVFKELRRGLNNHDFDSVLIPNLNQAKKDYLFELRKELSYYNSQAKEAYDLAIIPNINYEIDSIAEADAKKLQNKFSGGFLGFRKWALTFGRDEKKFQKLWEKYVETKGYDLIFDKYINDFLLDLFHLQSEIYGEVTGKKRKYLVKWNFMSDPLVIEFPKKEIIKIKQYISANKNTPIKDLLSFIPGVDGIMEIEESVEMLNAMNHPDEAANDYSDDEQLRLLCQQLIVMQVSEKYYQKCREKVFTIINNSYNKLLVDIEKTL